MGLQLSFFSCISIAVNPDQLGYGAPINLVLYPIPTGTALPRMHEFTMKKWDANTLSGVSNEQYFDYQDLI
jgi:hypothetical protein